MLLEEDVTAADAALVDVVAEEVDEAGAAVATVTAASRAVCATIPR